MSTIYRQYVKSFEAKDEKVLAEDIETFFSETGTRGLPKRTIEEISHSIQKNAGWSTHHALVRYHRN